MHLYCCAACLYCSEYCACFTVFQQNEVDRDSNKDRPPTPPEPLPVKKGGGDSRSVSGSSDFNSADEVNTVCTLVAS